MAILYIIRGTKGGVYVKNVRKFSQLQRQFCHEDAIMRRKDSVKYHRTAKMLFLILA